MTDELPTSDEYEQVREIAAMYLDTAKEETDEELGVSLDFPSPIDTWAFRIHIYEKDVSPDERKHWQYQGAEAEMENGIGTSHD